MKDLTIITRTGHDHRRQLAARPVAAKRAEQKPAARPTGNRHARNVPRHLQERRTANARDPEMAASPGSVYNRGVISPAGLNYIKNAAPQTLNSNKDRLSCLSISRLR